MILLWSQLIVLAVAAAALATALGVRVLGRRSRGAGLRRQLHELGGRVGAECADDHFAADHRGQRVTARIAGHRGAPAAIEVSVDLDAVARDPADLAGGYRQSARVEVRGRPEIRLAKGGRWSGLRARIGLHRRPCTGDEALDRAAWLDTVATDPEVAEVLAEPRARRAMLDLLEAGVDEVTINHGGAALTAAFVGLNEEHLNVYTFREVAEALAGAARALPAFEPAAARRRRGEALVALPLSIVLALAAPAVPLVCLMCWPVLEPQGALTPAACGVGSVVGLGAWAASLPVLAWRARRRPGSAGRLMGVAAALLVALPWYATGALVCLNAVLDGSVVERPGVVAVAEMSPDPAKRRHVLEADWWGEERDAYEARHVSVPAPFGFQPEPRCCAQEVTLVTGTGRFGWDWLRGARCGESEAERSALRERARRATPEASDVAIRRVDARYGKPPLRTLYLDVQIRNAAPERRWFFFPEATGDNPAPSPGELVAVSAQELGCSGRVVVLELIRRNGGDLRAVFLPAHAEVTIHRFSVTSRSEELPDRARIEVASAAQLTLGGEPAEALFASSLLSDEVAAVKEDRHTEGHVLRKRPGLDESPRAIGISEPQRVLVVEEEPVKRLQ